MSTGLQKRFIQRVIFVKLSCGREELFADRVGIDQELSERQRFDLRDWPIILYKDA
jgi:hypothetical protein